MALKVHEDVERVIATRCARRCLSRWRRSWATGVAGWARGAGGDAAGAGRRASASASCSTAHRALEAVDCTSREDATARAASRAVLRPRRPRERFDLAFMAVFGSGRPIGQSPFDELGGIEREALPHAGLADRRTAAAAVARAASEPGAGRLERGRAAAAQGLRHVHRRRDGARAAADRAARAPRARRGCRDGRGRLGAAATRPTCGASCARRCAPAASRSHRHWRAPSRRPRPVVLVCDVSGSMTPVRADAAPVPARLASPRAAGSRRSRSARG